MESYFQCTALRRFKEGHMHVRLFNCSRMENADTRRSVCLARPNARAHTGLVAKPRKTRPTETVTCLFFTERN